MKPLPLLAAMCRKDEAKGQQHVVLWKGAGGRGGAGSRTLTAACSIAAPR